MREDKYKLTKALHKLADLMIAKVCFANCRREGYRETHLLNPKALDRRTHLELFRWYKKLTPEDKAKYPSELIVEIDGHFRDVIEMLAEEIIMERRRHCSLPDVTIGSDIAGKQGFSYLEFRRNSLQGVDSSDTVADGVNFYPFWAPIPPQEIVATEIGLNVEDLRRAQERIDKGAAVKWSYRYVPVPGDPDYCPFCGSHDFRSDEERVYRTICYAYWQRLVGWKRGTSFEEMTQGG